jgi:hypothetical protein
LDGLRVDDARAGGLAPDLISVRKVHLPRPAALAIEPRIRLDRESVWLDASATTDRS